MKSAQLTHQPSEARKHPARARKVKPEPAPVIDFANARLPRGDTANVIDLQERSGPPELFAATLALRRAISQAGRHDLPKREALEAHFDRSLRQFSAVWSDEISHILKALGAEAAVLGEKMILPRADVSFETLLHETAHLLQVTTSGAVNDNLAPAEAEAEARVDAPGEVHARLAPDQFAFRDTQVPGDEKTELESRQAFHAEKATQEVKDGGGDDAEAKDTVQDESTVKPEEATSEQEVTDQSSGEGAAPQPGLESEVPPLPEEAQAAKDSFDASVAALSEAATPEAYLAAFTAAPPSLKAEKAPTLDADLAAISSDEAKAFTDAQPDFEATISGEEAPPAPAEIAVPDVIAPELEVAPPALAPEPDIAPTAVVEKSDGEAFAGDWRPPAAERADPAEVAGAIKNVKTTADVETSPGPAPSVPLQGESDPARAGAQREAASQDAAVKQQQAAQAVIEGKGPEQIAAKEAKEAVPLELEAPQTQLDAMAPVDGAQEFLNQPLDGDTKAVFDAHHDTAMRDSLAQSQAEMEAMVAERDDKREAETTKARADVAQAEADANAQQADEMAKSRQAIQDKRQETLNEQDAAVSQMNEEAKAEDAKTRDQIDARVQEDEAKIAADFAQAEKDADAKLKEGEDKAEAEKKQAEKDAEDSSWWDRAVSWVSEQLSKLGEAIGKIFDAVRAGINTILDGVKNLAFALIDAAAGFIKGAIALYGEFLKLAVTNLIGAVFPELAQKLNAFIDEGVKAFQAAVDKVAAGMKAAVNAVVELYKAALNVILNFVQGALNTVLAVAQAALAGDWGEVARLIIEPILAMLGINKDDFYAFIGNATEGLMKIVNDPLAFLGHLLDTVVGGFKLFGQNFVDHLIGGIIGWLTGALGGDITIPKTWDLLGVLDLARQILGLTVDMLRKIAVRILGEAAVEKIEFFIDYAQELITGGWGAFFTKIKDDLGSLFSMVMGEITTFLLERVVKAGIVWLASLINPAGALVKLVLMIWDFVMWMKDNFMRFVDIIKTVVNGMVDIAHGKIEPASKAIERVLGNLLAPAIDLIARLIGLGNVAGRVRKIIEKIRKTIEDAVVKLIKKVLAKFTGKGGGKSAKQDDDKAASGDLMNPMAFKGAGESHTLYLEKRGKDVVPMMRSTPTEVGVWLKGLREEANVRPYVERAARGEAKKDPKLSELTKARTQEVGELIPAALKEVGQLDAEGEQALKAEEKKAANLAKEKGDVAQEAQETVSALERILKALGVEAEEAELAIKFGPHLDKIDPAYRDSVKSQTVLKISKDATKAPKYTAMTWAQFTAGVSNDQSIWPKGWNEPLHSGGPLRANKAFMDEVFLHAAAVTATPSEDYANQTYAQLFPVAERDKLQTEFVKSYLIASSKDLGLLRIFVEQMLDPAPASYNAWLFSAFKAVIEEALKRFAKKGTKPKPDQEFKDAVKDAPFKGPDGVFASGEYQTKTYFFPASMKAKDVRIPDFLDAGVSKNFQGNITHMADRIRAADKGKHEWLPASLAVKAMEEAVNLVGTPKFGPAAEGYADLLYFQHHVRTDTSHIIFDPAYVEKNKKIQRADYLSKGHVAALKEGTLSTTAPLTEDQRKEFYPDNKKGEKIRVLQGHAGGIYYREGIYNDAGALVGVNYQVSQGLSSTWHGSKGSGKGVFGLAEELFASGVDNTTMNKFGNAILGYFKETVLDEQSDYSKLTKAEIGFGPFELYKFSNSELGEYSDFNAMMTAIIANSKQEETDLLGRIQTAIPGFTTSGS
ncbi:hypothetical protein ATO10_02910 [Actibacterium atlanticum]|uniref:DUF4157 domain-containing protein n=1 Tax=Actibacterium atlanticum TaxID=1461693 RepID=A0A058ZS75_9RHOB|nr:hypothetical protein [Actibacterium atlanticum]KCV83676.1 hypothetical protein ATO10_02910 [Actibacterium atlanticum]